MASEEDIRRAAEVLEALLEDPSALVRLPEAERRRLLEAAGKLSRPTPDERRARARAFRRKDRTESRARDEATLSAADLRRQKSLSAFLPEAIHKLLDIPLPAADPSQDEEARLEQPRACYVCKVDYDRVHFFYHSMCPACAALNWEKRSQTADLTGKVALVTGARIKIGYHTALMLLRAGARVIATTRFPVDAARRFAAEPDYPTFYDRLEVHGLDLRHTPTVEAFAARLLDELDRLDVLINNAAQTVRRPPAFYGHLLEAERAPAAELGAAVSRVLATRPEPAALAPGAWADEPALDPALFPSGLYDRDDQQIDLRATNSWRLGLDEVPTPEVLEVHLVNAIAPFVLTSRLKPLMMRARTNDKHVIHVSAMEASFSRRKKTTRHPHTNMAKAALNMMTRTSAADWAKVGIYMNSVDTGWVTDEDPLAHAARKQRVHDFHAPLDSIDGAARVLDPLFVGLNTGEHPWGLFLKDYRPVSW
ncbi:MAG: SDR family oxidoreductase [Myxococcales bacterium]|nr:SDR family oxidoreductase [Myxococcales bacterium]